MVSAAIQAPADSSGSTSDKKPWFKHSKVYSIEKRPSFTQWLKMTFLDVLTLVVIGGIAIGISFLGPAADRAFPLVIGNTGEIVYPQFAYPYRPQIISSLLDALIAVCVPIFVIILLQTRIRSFWDVNNAIFGLLYAIILSSAFQVTLKWLVGGLRPNFYDVCQPDPFAASTIIGSGPQYGSYMFTRDICTTGSSRMIDNALQSFPSGHSTTIFAAMVFLSLYLNAKLKVFSNYQPRVWKLILMFFPILGATLIAGSLTVDYSHNWYDIVAGAAIGTMFAFASYRVMYAAIWDYRVNHIPLNRAKAFEDGEDMEESGLVATARAGWRKGKDTTLPTQENAV